MSLFSDNLKRKRLKCGYSQKELAEKSGVHESAMQKYEYGTVVPKLDTATAIADALDVSLDYLTGRTDNTNSHKL